MVAVVTSSRRSGGAAAAALAALVLAMVAAGLGGAAAAAGPSYSSFLRGRGNGIEQRALDDILNDVQIFENTVRKLDYSDAKINLNLKF